MVLYFQMQYFQGLKCVSSTVKTRHYSCSHVEHQARSIIFLENHYGCVHPLGGSTGRENRSSGMMISSDLITSGAKPDNGKWFLALSVSICQIHDGTKIALMNSWHSKIQNFSFWMRSVESGCHFPICEKTIYKFLGTCSTSHCTVCEEVIKCHTYLHPHYNKQTSHSHIILVDNSHRWVISWSVLKAMLFFHQLIWSWRPPSYKMRTVITDPWEV